MIGDLFTNHTQIARQIKAIERAVLAFQPVMVGAAGGRVAVDTNIAIILSARLSNVWKRIGEIFPTDHVPPESNGGARTIKTFRARAARVALRGNGNGNGNGNGKKPAPRSPSSSGS